MTATHRQFRRWQNRIPISAIAGYAQEDARES
jgi:hypothetical protein